MNRRRHRKNTRTRIKGFTLLEVLVAFTLLAVSFGVIMEIIAGSSRNTQKAAYNTKIALLAQSKMDELGLLEIIEEGVTNGEFDDQTSWELEITPYDVPYEGDYNQDFTAVVLMDIKLIVTTENRRKRSNIEFRTLRAVTPDFSKSR